MQESLVPPRSLSSGAPAHAAATTARSRAAIEATCSIRVIQPFARYLARIGRDCEAWLGPHGLSMATFNERDLRVPHAAGDGAPGRRRGAVRRSGDRDPRRALRRARRLRRHRVRGGQLCQGRRGAPARGAVHRAHGTTAILHGARRGPAAGRAARARALAASSTPRPAVEFLFASLLAYGSRSVGHPTRPLRVELAHPAPPGRRPGSTRRRSARSGSVARPTRCGSTPRRSDLPHRAPDRSLLQILTDHADGAAPSAVAAAARRSPSAHAPRSPRPCWPGTRAPTRSPAGSRCRCARCTAGSPRRARRTASWSTTCGASRRCCTSAASRFSIGEIAFLLGFAHPNGVSQGIQALDPDDAGPVSRRRAVLGPPVAAVRWVDVQVAHTSTCLSALERRAPMARPQSFVFAGIHLHGLAVWDGKLAHGDGPRSLASMFGRDM